MKILYPQLVCFGYHFLENLPYLDRGGGVLARQKDFLNISENVGWYGFGPRKKTTLLNSGSTEMKE